MTDLKSMEEDAGIKLKLKNKEPYILRGTTANVATDGLAAHQMFNLLSPSALHFCRMCEITRYELHEVPHFIRTLRTKERLKEQIETLLDKKAAPKDFGWILIGQKTSVLTTCTTFLKAFVNLF